MSKRKPVVYGNQSDAVVKQRLRDSGRADEAEPPTKNARRGGDWETRDVKITAAGARQGRKRQAQQSQPVPETAPRRRRPVEVFADSFSQMIVRNHGGNRIYYGDREVSAESHDGCLKPGGEKVIDRSTWFVSEGDSNMQAHPYDREGQAA